jgi:pyrroline-5-carboxylate reductase
MKSITEITVGLIGCGAMGSALAKAIAKIIPPVHITLANRTPEKEKMLAAEIGAQTAASNIELARQSDVVFLGVKPYQIADVLKEIAPVLGGKTLVSMAAGVSIAAIKDHIMRAGAEKNPQVVIRIMPNTPVSVGEGMIALSAESAIRKSKVENAIRNTDTETENTQQAAELVTKLLSAGGKVEQVSESLITCVGAVSGCGPAYGFIFIEALADAAVSMGMPRSQAYIYAAQTLKGAGALVLETRQHPAVLKDAVCSPGGSTIEAVQVLEERGFRAAIINAAQAAAQKSIEMAFPARDKTECS